MMPCARGAGLPGKGAVTIHTAAMPHSDPRPYFAALPACRSARDAARLPAGGTLCGQRRLHPADVPHPPRPRRQEPSQQQPKARGLHAGDYYPFASTAVVAHKRSLPTTSGNHSLPSDALPALPRRRPAAACSTLCSTPARATWRWGQTRHWALPLRMPALTYGTHRAPAN